MCEMILGSVEVRMNSFYPCFGVGFLFFVTMVGNNCKEGHKRMDNQVNATNICEKCKQCVECQECTADKKIADKIKGNQAKQEKNIFQIKLAEFISTGFLLLVIAVSLIVVVAIQIASKETDYKEAATISNTYTGIVLGFVAMTVSLIGMVLSFHNTKQSEQSNLESNIAFLKLTNSIEAIKEMESTLSESLAKLDQKTVSMENFEEIKNQLQRLTRELEKNVDEGKGRGRGSVTALYGYQQEAPDVDDCPQNSNQEECLKAQEEE